MLNVLSRIVRAFSSIHTRREKMKFAKMRSTPGWLQASFCGLFPGPLLFKALLQPHPALEPFSPLDEVAASFQVHPCFVMYSEVRPSPCCVAVAVSVY